ncbi:NO-inducible flavohemoprotein [Salinisphaera sp. SPP-AMP-43]|uniref:NO-inducible flavohemoprotein n=1 Tax=Salinisphaera sp. SPP-AMP-43 TaxID=3121288 RepID=UPI003C6E2C0E
MPSRDQVAVIQQTVPALQQYGEQLARHMYARMFAHNPEVRRYFNPAHQRTGQQQKALSDAVCAYAANIDHPTALEGAVELIAHKHVSLGIAPEHYPIVGRHLLASIREVLGPAATDDVIDAWATAYDELAHLFIERERQLYAEQLRDHGWTGFKPFVVTERETVAENVVSLYLAPLDQRSLACHKPGRYIAIHQAPAAGESAPRHYSLSNAPGTPYYRISIKYETADSSETPSGMFSSFAHEQLKTGDHVQVSPPCGQFTLELPEQPMRPLVLIAGGIGITPLLSMLHAALAEPGDRPLVLIQAVRDRDRRPFAAEIDALAYQHPRLQVHICYSAPGDGDLAVADVSASEGYVSDSLLERALGDAAADYYFCGPRPMMAGVAELLRDRGVPQEAVHYEFFGPAGTETA